jgi:hypothetical protein
VTTSPGFTLEQVVPWGRSFSEYERIFALDASDLEKPILGCGDGPASFNAEASKRGHRVVSCDPLYQFSASEIEQRVEETYETVVGQTREHRHQFVWNEFISPEQLGKHRLAVMRRFLTDYEEGKREGRYVAAGLPELPFRDSTFGFALCSHFLFLYTAQLSLDFHLASLTELCRVAPEVRVFPLLDLHAQESSYVDPAIEYLTAQGLHARRVRVPYEFQVGGHTALFVSRIPA